MIQTPVFFISHGAPTFALEPGKLGARLSALGRELSAVKAVLVVSPHWQTDGVKIMANPSPATLHDFGGFPRELYGLQYPASGHLQFAVEASQLLAGAGFEVSLDDERGLDHGAWVPLMHLLPPADIPVFQVSMPHTLDAAGALYLGRTLAPLRQRGVLIVGSGSMTHNLYEVRQSGTGEAAYAREFTAWVRQAVLAGAVDTLVDYRRLAPDAGRAHPTEEHFLPLLVAVGAGGGESSVQVIEGGITYGVLSMESYVWGLAESSRHVPE
ncbi:MAG: dioxygenase [Betaproteobacteria bacterium]|nr:dioxygenase [Betaproteobacteria bacterium]